MPTFAIPQLTGPNKVLSDWTYSLAVLPGLFVGMLVWSRIGHLLQVFIKETSASSLRNQVIGVITFVVCWLGLFGGLAYYVFSEHNGSIGWFWFIVGIAATPCIILPPAFYFLQRGRRRQAEYNADGRSDRRSKETYDYEITFDVFDGDSSAFAALVFVMGILGGLFAYRASRKILFSDFGYASHMGKTSTYTLSANGLEVAGPRPYHKILWPDLIKWPDVWTATRFTDGIFLFGGGALAWLPDSALADASPHDAAQFIGKRMRLRTAR